MSASGIPYHLRPHKAVDRRLFLDLLSRCERWQPLQDFAYISMGGYPLEDHKAIHRRFGITRLLAFDNDEAIVRRQTFNRPTSACKCFHRDSADVVASLDGILSEARFSDAEGVIVWLDYTNTQIGAQLRQFQSTLEQVAPNDIVRITLNAKADNLGLPDRTGGRRTSKDHVDEHRLEVLFKRAGDFLPSGVTRESVSQANYPRTLALALRAAAGKAFSPTDPYVFSPLSLMTYADQQPMLSMTGMKIARSDEEEMRKTLGLANWPFSSVDWTDVHQLAVADLTVRERLFLERAILRLSPAQMEEQLGFDLEAVTDVPGFLSNYKKYHRFYPTFLSAEV